MAKNLGMRGLIYSKYESESQFARTLGWSRQRLFKITNGRKIPTLFEVNDMADALGVHFMEVAAFYLPEKSTTVDAPWHTF